MLREAVLGLVEEAEMRVRQEEGSRGTLSTIQCDPGLELTLSRRGNGERSYDDKETSEIFLLDSLCHGSGGVPAPAVCFSSTKRTHP